MHYLVKMQHQICKSLLHPFVARVSYPVGHALRPVPSCFVRYRKVPWTPLSPTKLFVVKEKKPQDPVERAIVYELHCRYKTALKALRVYFREEIAAREAKLSDQSHLDADKQHHVWALEQNNEFNRQSAVLRDERAAREVRQKEEEELQLLVEMEQLKKKQQEQATEQVCKVKADAVDFITVDKLDSAIESALNTRRVHNFAIDVDGHRYIEQPDGSTIVRRISEQQLTDST